MSGQNTLRTWKGSSINDVMALGGGSKVVCDGNISFSAEIAAMIVG